MSSTDVRPQAVTVQLPDRLLENIIRLINPRRVILFGSRARGDARENSDWDFMIVVDDDTRQEQVNWQVMGQVRRGVRAALELIPFRELTFRERQYVQGSLPWRAATEGLLSMSGHTRLIRSAGLKSVQWLRRADEDIRLAEKIAADPDFLASAAFHCQQAVEKMAKVVIVAYQTEYPRTHDLAQLGVAVAALRLDLGESIAGLSGLTDWYVTPRYPGLEYRPSQQDVAMTLQKLNELRAQIEFLAPKRGV